MTTQEEPMSVPVAGLEPGVEVEPARPATERAMASALHRMNLPECEPDADDYSDEAEHLFAAHDLLGNLAAHGWLLARSCGDLHGVCLYAGPHDGPHKVPPGHPLLSETPR